MIIGYLNVVSFDRVSTLVLISYRKIIERIEKWNKLRIKLIIIGGNLNNVTT